MPIPSDRLYAIADNVRAAVAGGLDAPPARQYVTIGLPAFDCEELVVAVDTIVGHDGNPAVETIAPMNCLTMRAVNLSIWLIRCVPSLLDAETPPAASVIDASGAAMLADVVAITNSIVAAFQAGTLSTTTGLVLMQGSGVTASGGFGGWVQRVRLDLTHV